MIDDLDSLLQLPFLKELTFNIDPEFKSDFLMTSNLEYLSLANVLLDTNQTISFPKTLKTLVMQFYNTKLMVEKL